MGSSLFAPSYNTSTMNALQRTAMNFALPRVRSAMTTRSMAEGSRAHLYKDIPTNMKQLRTNIWLSDPGAYPVIVVLSFALVMCGSYMGYCSLCSPDVRISMTKRQQLIRDWEK